MTAKTEKLIVTGAYILTAVAVIIVFVYKLCFWRISFLPSKTDEIKLTHEQAARACPEALLTQEDIDWLELFYALPGAVELAEAGESYKFQLSETDLPFHPKYDNVDCGIKVYYASDMIHITADSAEFRDGSGYKSFYISVGFPYGYTDGMTPDAAEDYFKQITYKGLDGNVDKRCHSSQNGAKMIRLSYGLANQLVGWWDALMGI